MAGSDLYAAAPPLLQSDRTVLRLAGCEQVLADFYGKVFAEYLLVAVGFQIQLERFCFNSAAVGFNADGRLVKIGLSGDRAGGRKLVAMILDALAARGNAIQLPEFIDGFTECSIFRFHRCLTSTNCVNDS